MNVGRNVLRLVIATAAALIVVQAHAFSGVVVAVHDGDTVAVLRSDKTTVKVRLASIDAPELDQPYGRKSKKALSDLIYGKTVEVDDRGVDLYGRTIGLILAPLDVSEEMVREGAAWDFVKYNTDPALPGIEQRARSLSLGLWSLPAPIAPWDWRHAKREANGRPHG